VSSTFTVAAPTIIHWSTAAVPPAQRFEYYANALSAAVFDQLAVAQIAARTGFARTTQFARVPRQHSGRSPAMWRRRTLAEPMTA
jgi:AraC-like DNA-binding protein